MSNCLLKSAFVCAVVIFVAKLFGALVSDVWLIIVYGAPKDAVTWLYMLLNYLSRIIIAAIAYLAVFISMTFLMKNTKSEK